MKLPTLTGRTKESQAARILRELKKRKVMTNHDLNLICFRYAARIWELNREFREAGTGERIVCVRRKAGLFEYHYLPGAAS